jgi:hypothetical protein
MLSFSSLYVAAFDVESPASFLITVPFPKAQSLIDIFGRNFDLMSDYLSFSRNKLVILNPVGIILVLTHFDRARPREFKMT